VPIPLYIDGGVGIVVASGDEGDDGFEFSEQSVLEDDKALSKESVGDGDRDRDRPSR